MRSEGDPRFLRPTTHEKSPNFLVRILTLEPPPLPQSPRKNRHSRARSSPFRLHVLYLDTIDATSSTMNDLSPTDRPLETIVPSIMSPTFQHSGLDYPVLNVAPIMSHSLSYLVA